jgi:hypothetical protein
MDSVIKSRQAPKGRLANHPLHVYRHVDIEKLKSKAPHGVTPLNLHGARLRGCFSARPVQHAEQTQIAEQPFGGAL